MEKYKWHIIGGAAALAVLIIVLSVYISRRNRDRRTYENFDVVGKTTEFAETSEAHYLPSAKGVFRYTRDGAEIVDQKGKTVVAVSYNMNRPYGDTCGNSAAVGEVGGKSLVIIDPSGNSTPITTAYQIVKVQVASQGVTAVWMNNGDEDFIRLYQADGKVIVDMNTLVSTSGFPIDFSLSNDGTKLVTAFASFKEDHLQTQLSFYNFGDVGGNYYDGLVAVEIFADEMIADVEFVNNNTVAAYGDKGVRIYDMEEIADLRHEITSDTPITMVSYSDSCVALVVENSGEGANFLARIYDLEGKLLDERGIAELYTDFLIDGNDAIMFNDSEVYIYRIGGKDKIRVNLTKGLSYAAALNGTNEYLFVGDTYLEKVRLVGDKK
ncbi:MAG: hypothetical protein J5648_05640 [Lachnospiraceae bacterium]|nr:hypothetical protein [Lachnospiraceae bacterium]